MVEYSVDAAQNYTVQFSEIWAADADGKNVRRITWGHTDGDARVSPDNNKFAFVRRGDIWIADGKGARQITKTSEANDSNPEFSNDGKTLFFIRSDILDFGAKTSDGLKITVPGSGKVITYSLVSGEERDLFVDGRHVNGNAAISQRVRRRTARQCRLENTSAPAHCQNVQLVLYSKCARKLGLRNIAKFTTTTRVVK